MFTHADHALSLGVCPPAMPALRRQVAACRAAGPLQRCGVAVGTRAACPATSAPRSHPSTLQVAVLHSPVLEPAAPCQFRSNLSTGLSPTSAGLQVGRARASVGPVLRGPRWGRVSLHPEPACSRGRFFPGRRGSWAWGQPLCKLANPAFPLSQGFPARELQTYRATWTC